MTISRTGVLAAALLSLALAGCQSSRFSPMEARQPAPAPLPAAPAGTVTAGQLPPPTQPGTTDTSQFPPAPGTETTVAAGDQQPATATSTVVASLPANAPAVSAGSVAGVWNASVSGQSCRIATPQTRFGQGFRAGPLRCPAPLDGVRSWNVAGSQLTLFDDGGNALANLYSSGGERFDGQTSSGQPISLSR